MVSLYLCVCSNGGGVEWCPSLRCGFAFRSVREGQRLDVWSCLSMMHMRQSPWDATDTFSWHRGATHTSPCIRFSLSVSGRLVCMSYFCSEVRSCVLELRLRYCLIVHPLTKGDKYGTLVNDYWRKTGRQRLTCRIANLSTTNTRWVALGFNPGLQVEKPGK